MGRRFSISTEVAFVGTVVGAILGWLAVSRQEPLERPEWWLAVGVPSLAGILLIGLIFAVPSVTGDSPLRRPLTWTLPALHCALTALLAKALVTGPAALAVPPSLRPIEVWLSVPLLAVLYVGQVLVLEVIVAVSQFRSRSSSREGSNS